MKCKKCRQTFSHRAVKSNYCSIGCMKLDNGFFSQNQIRKQKARIRRNDGLDWQRMWKRFWKNYYGMSVKFRDDYFQSMLDLMPEKYTNNKSEIKFDLFKPNHIKL